MTELNHILAWLHLALGHLYVGVALTSPLNPAFSNSFKSVTSAGP